MDWEQKLAVMKALSETSLMMRKPGDWYVSQTGIDIGGDGMLLGAYGNGNSPQQAVENHFDQYTKLAGDKYVVVSKRGERRQVRWNGYMWEDVAR